MGRHEFPAGSATQSGADSVAGTRASSQVTHIAVGGPVSELAEGDGAVWGSSPYLSALLRIDEHTNMVVATIKVGTQPDSVAFGAGSAWVANRSQVGTVLRVDPTTNRVVATVTVGGLPDEIAFADGSLWAANAGSATVSKIDPATNHVVATMHIGSRPAWVARERCGSPTPTPGRSTGSIPAPTR